MNRSRRGHAHTAGRARSSTVEHGRAMPPTIAPLSVVTTTARAAGRIAATLTGRWPCASNCLHSRWITLGAVVRDEQGTTEQSRRSPPLTVLRRRSHLLGASTTDCPAQHPNRPPTHLTQPPPQSHLHRHRRRNRRKRTTVRRLTLRRWATAPERRVGRVSVLTGGDHETAPLPPGSADVGSDDCAHACPVAASQVSQGCRAVTVER